MAEVRLVKMVAGVPMQHDTTADSLRAASLGAGVAAPASGFACGGAMVLKVTPVSDAHVVGADDHVLAVDGGLLGAIVITLPAAPEKGREIKVLDDGGLISAVDTVTVAGNGKSIGALGSQIIAVAHGRLHIVYTGTRWAIVSSVLA